MNLRIHIISLGVIFSLVPLASSSRALAYGECDEYGLMAQYNSLTNTCSCISGWVFDNTILGKQCVSTSEYCRDRIGLMSTYNSLYDRCECMSGYVLEEDSFGNENCVNGDLACHGDLGIHSSYESLTNKCVCDYGYTIKNGKCTSLDDQCQVQLGLFSSFNVLTDMCQCDFGYVINEANKCEEANSVCRRELGYYSSYDLLTNKCECDDEYTLSEEGECVEKQHNVYFNLRELDIDKQEAIIQSDYDHSYYQISYGIGCLSFYRYEEQKIVVNLGTDYSLDAWDKIVLQDDDETCSIVTEEKVSPNFSLESRIPGSAYLLSASDIFERDIANSRYKESIKSLKDQGIVSGYPDGTYGPERQINRAEFIKIVIGALGVNPIGTNCYPDVRQEWFAASICTAKELKIASGYPEGGFGPSNNINVVEAFKIVLNGFHLKVRDLRDGEEWFKPYVESADHYGIYLQTFDSLGKEITRGEMAEIINRIISLDPSIK